MACKGKRKTKGGVANQITLWTVRRCNPLLIPHSHAQGRTSSFIHPHFLPSALLSIHCLTCKNMADKPNMTEITSFDKTKLRKTETQEKNPLPTKETIEQERQGESTP
ncbi:thymosin beta [Pimephales promelas]|uniref:thymosin beta n=1 Tax=Pimephales promelas TaxID=90988 RepID=UPI0019556DEF|nr:thymosin beta [Pimephales promelas]